MINTFDTVEKIKKKEEEKEEKNKRLDTDWQIPLRGPFTEQGSFHATLLIKKHTREGNVSPTSKYAPMRKTGLQGKVW